MGFDLNFADGGLTLAGVGSTSGTALTGFLVDYHESFAAVTFCESATEGSHINCGQLSMTGTYTDEAGASFTSGPGMRSATTFRFTRPKLATVLNCAAISAVAQSSAAQGIIITIGADATWVPGSSSPLAALRDGPMEWARQATEIVEPPPLGSREA